LAKAARSVFAPLAVGRAGGMKRYILGRQGLTIGAHPGVAVNGHRSFSTFVHDLRTKYSEQNQRQLFCTKLMNCAHVNAGEA
jgi:hypothetical protein